MIESGDLRRFWLRSLSAFAKHPFAHEGRAFRQFNALVFATHKELDRSDVHQGYLAQVQDAACANVIHCRSYAADRIGLNAAA